MVVQRNFRTPHHFLAQQREPARSVQIFFKFILASKKIENKICRLENAGLSYRYKRMEQLGRITLAQLWNDPGMISGGLLAFLERK